jgi:hypothetical protein
LTSPAAEAKAIEVVYEFMDTQFDDEADGAAWLVKRISAAFVEAGRAGQEAAMLFLRRDG